MSSEISESRPTSFQTMAGVAEYWEEQYCRAERRADEAEAECAKLRAIIKADREFYLRDLARLREGG